jgi:hypothetical protein
LLTAVGLSILTLDGDLLNVEVAALPFFLAALLLAVQKGAYWALAAGLFAAAALLIRPSYALDCATVLVALIFARQAFLRLALAAIGALLVVGSTAVALAVGGSLDPYVGIVSETQRAYLLWSNGDSLFPLILRIAVGAAIAVIWFWRAANRSCRLLAIWLPASAIGASLTPRELSHYAIEVIPPLSVAIAALTSAALKSLSAGRPWPRFASAIVATPVALIMLVGGAEVVLIAPAQEVALLRSTHAPPPFLHNFSYARLPAYYGRWLRWMTQHPFTTQGLTGFPGPIREEIAEARVLDQLADDSSTRVLVLGDRAVTYFLARRRPATRYVAQNSGFRLVPDASTEVGTSLDARRAEVVAIADAPPGDWRSRLEDDGYRLVASYPWQTYRSEP